jgi:GNAT superfamily N-acetyltransferase
VAGKFIFKKFSEIDLGDGFFDELKSDYPGNANSTGFVEWFNKKAAANSTALVFDDDEGLGAFVYLKSENEPIELAGRTLPAIPRIKIGTLRLAERYRGQRLGEGAIGLALWKWQRTKREEIYVTVFEKHDALIGQLERFGFLCAGGNPNGERVYVKSRKAIDYGDPYKAFPFVNPAFAKSGYLIVDDNYHDTLFPYSELKNTLQEKVAIAVANGLTKIYIGAQFTRPHYQPGEPVLIYRKHTGEGAKRYKSCITSYCIVTDVIMAKTNNRTLIPLEDLLARLGNKSVFDENEIRARYANDRNMVIIEMLYCGFFGEGNNVNMDWLDRNGYWSKEDEYPANVQLSPEQFRAILREGNVDVSNVVVGQS